MNEHSHSWTFTLASASEDLLHMNGYSHSWTFIVQISCENRIQMNRGSFETRLLHSCAANLQIHSRVWMFLSVNVHSREFASRVSIHMRREFIWIHVRRELIWIHMRREFIWVAVTNVFESDTTRIWDVTHSFHSLIHIGRDSFIHSLIEMWLTRSFTHSYRTSHLIWMCDTLTLIWMSDSLTLTWMSATHSFTHSYGTWLIHSFNSFIWDVTHYRILHSCRDNRIRIRHNSYMRPDSLIHSLIHMGRDSFIHLTHSYETWLITWYCTVAVTNVFEWDTTLIWDVTDSFIHSFIDSLTHMGRDSFIHLIHSYETWLITWYCTVAVTNESSAASITSENSQKSARY